MNILDSINDGILVIDRDYKVVFANKSLLQLVGLKAEDIIGKDCHAFSHSLPTPCHKREIETHLCPHQKVFTTGEAISVTHTHIMLGGIKRVFEITASPIKDEEGKTTQMIEILRDITVRSHIEKELKESEEEFRALVEHSLVGVYLIQDGIFKYVNPQLAKIFGYSQEELIEKKGPRDLTYPKDWHIVKENLRKRLEGEVESINYTFRGQRKSGEVFDVEVFGSRIIYKGRPAVIGTLMNITERKHYEKRLKDERTFLNAILDGVEVGIVVINRDFKILMANKKYCEMIKRPFEGVLGKYCYEASHNLDKPCYEIGEVCVVKQTFESGNIHSVIQTHQGKDGDPLYLQVRSYPIKAESGYVTSAIELIMGITEHYKLQKELEKKVKELEEFYDIAVTRELRMIELKEEIEKLKKEIKKFKESRI